MTIRVLGIDPGSQTTGYGVVDIDAGDVRYVASGCVRTRGDHLARLEEIYRALVHLVEEFRPGEIAVESVFVHRNAASALKLGQARAAALCGVFHGAFGLGIYEYTPRAVKQAIVGFGGAEKSQVEAMIKQLLRVDGSLQSDAADALAVALCHAHTRSAARARSAVDA